VTGGDEGPFAGVMDSIRLVQRKYAERKRQAGLMDFDDLLVLWVRLLQDFPDIAETYQRRFQFVLVDEYQDTNVLQATLLDCLTLRHRNLMAVGDDAQSIYSWRGANFANILKFPERHAGAKVFKIETNYRSTPEILALANAAIAANLRQFPKALQAARPSGQKPALIVATDAREQAAFVAQRALELRDEGIPLNEICVLYRSHFHALELQMELTRRDIPFVITSGIRFFEQAHIKDVAAYLKLIANPADELAFKRLVRMLPGVGGKSADTLWNAFSARFLPSSDSTPEFEASDNDGALPETRPVAPELSAIGRSVPKKAAVAWAQFTATIAQCESPERRGQPGRLIRLVLEADYEDYVRKTYENARNRLEDLAQLAAYADSFEDTSLFLSELALQSNLESEQNQARDGDDEDRLRLSTVHQAKGLEFRAVFVLMLCDGLFPSGRSVETADGEEEERRLFYVALTRAKDELYLCRPLLRFMAGTGEAFQPASRFLAEFPETLVEEWKIHAPVPPPPSRGLRPTPQPRHDPDPFGDPPPDPDPIDDGDVPF
jgi:DNA helicase-2/ATP-dependent DNA helicase PcrA